MKMASFEETPRALNQLTMQNSLGKPLSLATAAWFLALYHGSASWDVPTRDVFASAIEQHSRAFFDALGTTPSFTPKKDPRFDQIQAHMQQNKLEVVKIFTDLDSLEDFLGTVSSQEGYQRALSENDADFLFVCKHIRNFLQLPLHRRVCQFPYEGSIVRKDLLPMTVRKHCYQANGSGPKWWQPCYDLSTEFHLFMHDYQQRMRHNSLQTNASEMKNNRWIIKPAQGTQGKGHQIVFSQDEEGLRKAACFAPLVPRNKLPVVLSDESYNDYEENTGDRIVQLLIEHPLLIDCRKFDIRCFVFVRSFDPFVAFVPELHYARLANRPYSIEKLDDYQVALTVTAYDEDETIASAQERRFYTQLEECLADQYGPGVIDVKGMWNSTLDTLRDLFGTGASREIGCWPNSSAYYSVDVIYDASEMIQCDASSSIQSFIPQPKVLEVNFMGDWHGVDNAVLDKATFHEWIKDLLSVVVLSDRVSVESLDENPRLFRL